MTSVRTVAIALASTAQLITSGDEQLLAKQYVTACDTFRAATGKTVRLA